MPPFAARPAPSAECSNVADRGTRWWAVGTYPHLPGRAGLSMSVPGDADEQTLRGVRVLVVDDDPDSRGAVTSVLEHYGAIVMALGSGAAALEAIQIEPPDVLLADLLMPGIDGYTLIRCVRALPPERGGRTRAAALTAQAGPEERARILQAGFQYHLAKPVELDRLIGVVAILATKE